MQNSIQDVPSPIDLRSMLDALAWEQTAMQRPYRLDFFNAFATELQKLNRNNLHILELGSGPGFLAKHLIDKLPDIQMTLLDFSPAMHELAAKRLGNNPKVNYIHASFKDAGWEQNLEKFDAVVTNQAVHELRHKAYAVDLHKAVKQVLKPDGIYLMCDHYFGEGAMQNDQLYMSLAEQRASMETAGFAVTEVLVKGGRALYSASQLIL